jgi:Bacterial Ig-like domain (group 3)
LRVYASTFFAFSLIAGLCSAGGGVASAATGAAAGVTASATALTLSTPDVVFGDEEAEQFTATVSGAGATPTGTVTVTAGAAATIVCTITLAAGTGTCSPTADALPVGAATLTAAYGGDATYDVSSAPTASLEVSSGPPPTTANTTTTLGLAKASATYGDEQLEKISVTVASGLSDGNDLAGRVTVRSGAIKVCAFSLPPSGKGSCALKPTELLPGTAKLTAAYAGDNQFAPSVSAVKSLKVVKERTTTTVSLSATKVAYGTERNEHITAVVKPAHGGTPTGHVTVKAGGAAICVITLKSARGTCSPAAARLATGRYKITADYTGSGDVISSISAVRSLSVVKASSRTALSLSAAKVQYGSERSERVSVKIAPQSAGTPGGKVTVKAGGATLAVISLRSGQGSLTLSAKRLTAGSYTLVAIYSGNADFKGSTSAKRSLTVSSPPPQKAACHPRASSGNCYEPGEFCPKADHGETGVAGDGKTIVCEDNDGWRWEPVGNGSLSGI